MTQLLNEKQMRAHLVNRICAHSGVQARFCRAVGISPTIVSAAITKGPSARCITPRVAAVAGYKRVVAFEAAGRVYNEEEALAVLREQHAKCAVWELTKQLRKFERTGRVSSIRTAIARLLNARWFYAYTPLQQ